MPDAPLHPEDIKAELRKRHGTVRAFANKRALKPQAVADWLRGRAVLGVAAAIADELGLTEIHMSAPQSIKLDDSAPKSVTHRLNAEAR